MTALAVFIHLDGLGADRPASGACRRGPGTTRSIRACRVAAYQFYSLHLLVFSGLLAWLRRDFGPMNAAEIDALRAEHASSQVPENSAAPAEPDAEPPTRRAEASHRTFARGNGLAGGSVRGVTILGCWWTRMQALSSAGPGRGGTHGLAGPGLCTSAACGLLECTCASLVSMF